MKRIKGQINPRYTLMVGDLSMNQILQIREACGGLDSGLKAKVCAAVEAVWVAYWTAARCEKDWQNQFK